MIGNKCDAYPAESRLIALWLRSANKVAIAGYVEKVDRILERNPLEQGESRTGMVRPWFHRPISVLYQVEESSKRVAVMGIRWVGR